MNGRRSALVALAMVLLLALACGDDYTSGQPYRTPTPTMEPMVAAIVAAGAAEGEAERAASLATVQAASALATVGAAQVDAEAARLVPLAQAEATTRAIDARATIAALDAQATAAAWALQATRAAEAQSLQATQTADAQARTATADARAATSTAAAQAAAATAQADRRTATAEAVQATYQAAELERAALELERERVLQPVRTWGPVALIVVAVVGLVLTFWRAVVVLELRGRAIRRDLRGDAPLLALTGHNGAMVLYDPDRAFGPVTVIDAEAVTAPPLAPPEYQERTTARDQAVDLKTRGLPTQRQRVSRRAVPPPLNPMPAPGPRPLIRVVPPQRVLPWIEEVQGQLVEEEP